MKLRGVSGTDFWIVYGVLTVICCAWQAIKWLISKI